MTETIKSSIYTGPLEKKFVTSIIDNFRHMHTPPSWFSEQCSHLTFQLTATLGFKQPYDRLGLVRTGQGAWLARRGLADTNRKVRCQVLEELIYG